MLSYLNNMKTQLSFYVITVIFASFFSEYLYPLLAYNFDVIIKTIFTVLFGAILQFVALLPFVKGVMRKAHEDFFAQLKVLNEKNTHLDKEIDLLRTELKDTKVYLVGVEVEVRKFYYAETEMSRALTNVNNNMTELQRLVVKLSSESGVIRTALMNKILKKEEDVK